MENSDNGGIKETGLKVASVSESSPLKVMNIVSNPGTSNDADDNIVPLDSKSDSSVSSNTNSNQQKKSFLEEHRMEDDDDAKDETTNEIEAKHEDVVQGELDNNDEQEEGNVKEDSDEFIVSTIRGFNYITNATTSSHTLVKVKHEALKNI